MQSKHAAILTLHAMERTHLIALPHLHGQLHVQDMQGCRQLHALCHCSCPQLCQRRTQKGPGHCSLTVQSAEQVHQVLYTGVLRNLPSSPVVCCHTFCCLVNTQLHLEAWLHSYWQSALSI